MAVAPRYLPEVIKETQRYWEEQAGVPVSEADAKEIIANVAAFFDLLAQWEADQRRDDDAGGQQPRDGIGTSDLAPAKDRDTKTVSHAQPGCHTPRK